MTTEELKEVSKDYEMFNILLFNNSLPRKNQVDFRLHRLIFAAGYSMYRDKPDKRTGNRHVIAFCRYFKFTPLQMREILVHEMIHLWQQTNISEERYMRCSHFVAHERTFTTKMNTINIILEREGFDFRIDTVFKDKLHLEQLDAKKEFIMIFVKCEGYNHHPMFKTTEKHLDNILSSLKKIKEGWEEQDNAYKDRQSWGDVYMLKTKSYKFVPFGYVRTAPKKFTYDIDLDTQESLFEMFKDQCTKIEI